MKKFIPLTCLIFIPFFFINCSNESESHSKESSSLETEVVDGLEIGRIDNGEINSYLDAQTLSEDLQKALAKNEAFEGLNLQDMKIIKKFDKGNSEDYYMLVASNNDQTTVSAIFLEEKNGVLFIPGMSLDSDSQ